MPSHIAIALDSVTSTQDWAKTHNALFSPSILTCITAREQTEGRGRYGHTWHSPKDKNIYSSIIDVLSPTIPLQHYIKAASLGLYNMLFELQIPAKIKWPNDILVDNKKIAGVVVEQHSSGSRSWVLIGIGLNVHAHEQSSIINQPVTSLHMEGVHCSLEDALVLYKKHILTTLEWAKTNTQACHDLWQEQCSWILGSSIHTHHNHQRIEGTASHFSPEGELYMLTNAGPILVSSLG